eukprot:jgi/Picre1/27484/NNA_000451.t1
MTLLGFTTLSKPSPSYGACSVDEWFDTSATKGLMSPVSGGGSPDGDDSEGQKGVEKESDVTSKERKVLGNVTNTIKVVDPVVGWVLRSIIRGVWLKLEMLYS